MQRCGSVIKVREEHIAEYKRVHEAVWPEVLKTIEDCNIHNYSIFLRQLDDGDYYLFSYFEYMGEDLDADAAKMAADPMTQKWWEICKPMQQPLDACTADEWWAPMEEVFHCE